MGPPPSQVTTRYFAAFWARSPLPLMRPCNPGGSSLATDLDAAALLPCRPVKSGRTFGDALIDVSTFFPGCSRSDRPSRQPDRAAYHLSKSVPQRTRSSTTQDSHYDSRQSLREDDRWPVRCR
jgi:hypothetical protein